MAIVTKHSAAGFLAGVICVLLIELLADTWSLQGPGPAPQEARDDAARHELLGLNVADLSCQFQDLTGKLHSCAELRGRVTVLNLWATWCPPCREEMPSLQALWEHGDVAVYCISDEAPADIARHPIAQTLRMPLYAFQGNIPAPLQAKTLPQTYILDAQGRIVYVHVGGADWNHPEVRKMLAAVARMP
jgi:thiol-disulfide isomerase/thioredoxin